MKSLKDIVIDTYHKFGPEVVIDEANKKISLKDNLFFTHLTRAYYALRGYSVEIE